MATITDARSVQATLTTTTVDLACLTQFWDKIQVTNSDATNPLWIRFDLVDPVAAAEGTYLVQPSATKVFGPGGGIKNVAGVPGSVTAASTCHQVRVLGNGGSYGVEGRV